MSEYIAIKQMAALLWLSVQLRETEYLKMNKTTYNLLRINKYFKNKMKETLISKKIFYEWNPKRSTTVLG